VLPAASHSGCSYRFRFPYTVKAVSYSGTREVTTDVWRAGKAERPRGWCFAHRQRVKASGGGEVLLAAMRAYRSDNANGHPRRRLPLRIQ
jgi:hypothetical protein